MMPDGLAHNLNCTSNLATMDYDKDCTRCQKIRRVVYLRRKTVDHGASPQEEAIALEQADRLREQYKLKRGEVFDRQFEDVPTIVEATEVFRAAPKSRQSRMKPFIIDSIG